MRNRLAARERYRLATSAPRTASGFRSCWRTVRGVAIHDRCSLARPNATTPVVLLHGLAVSHRYLMPLAAELAGHHPVHVVDLPGFGLSGDPGRVLDVTEHADHLAAWLDAAGLPPVAVLGNSFGCQVAVELGVRHPDHVRGLVLVGPTMDPAARTAFRQVLRWLRDTAREDPMQLPILLRDVRDAGLRRVVGTLSYALRDPIEEKLPLVRVPVLVTRGSREPIVPAAWAAAAARLPPLGELAVVPGPHNATYGAADHLGQLVRAFLRRRVQVQGGQASRETVAAPAIPGSTPARLPGMVLGIAGPTGKGGAMDPNRKLYRSKSNRKLAGICGGLAQYFNLDATLIRVLFVLLAVLGGSGLVLYVAMWIIVPQEP